MNWSEYEERYGESREDFVGLDIEPFDNDNTWYCYYCHEELHGVESHYCAECKAIHTSTMLYQIAVVSRNHRRIVDKGLTKMQAEALLDEYRAIESCKVGVNVTSIFPDRKSVV